MGPKPEPKPLAMNRIPIPAAISPNPASIPISINRKICAPPPDDHSAFAITNLLTSGVVRIYFQPSVISLVTIFTDTLSRSVVSGPPKGRVIIHIAEARNVSASIHNAVVIPYSAIVKPPIDAPIPNARDHPPEPNALAVSNSSSSQIFGRYAYCAGSKIDFCGYHSNC